MDRRSSVAPILWIFVVCLVFELADAAAQAYPNRPIRYIETQLMIGPIPTAMPFIQQGRMRGLAVSSAKRLPDFPQYPTVAETVPGYEFDNWYGMLVPAKTPKEIISTLHRAALAALAKPHIVKQLANAGYVPVGSQPAEFAVFHKAEIAKLAKIIKLTGATAN